MDFAASNFAMTDMPSPKPWIDRIHAYVPGKSTAADGKPLVKLSANENPLGCSPQVLAARSEAAHPAIYPDPDARALGEAIGAAHGIDPTRIVCGAGSGELLSGAVQGFAGHGDEVLFSRYAFSLYPVLAHKVGAEPVLADDDDYAASVDNILAAVTDRTRVVLLDNPNNPTGTFLGRSEVGRLHGALPADVLLVLDQAYAEYLDASEDDGGLALAEQASNVLVTRTFSKAYGLAGERIGWATGAPGLIDILNRIRGPFNVAQTGQSAAVAALGDRDFVIRSRAHNSAELKRFTERIGALGNQGIRVLPSKANFALVLFEGGLDAHVALKAIADLGIAVRHLPGPGLGHGLRITIGTRPQMDAIAGRLAELAVQ